MATIVDPSAHHDVRLWKVDLRLCSDFSSSQPTTKASTSSRNLQEFHVDTYGDNSRSLRTSRPVFQICYVSCWSEPRVGMRIARASGSGYGLLGWWMTGMEDEVISRRYRSSIPEVTK
jgi:hypothetical protein